MQQDFEKEVARFREMTVIELRARYAELFGESTGVTNKGWLCKRLACGVPLTQEGIVLFIADLEIEAARLLDLCQQGGIQYEPRHPSAVDWKSYLLRRLDRIGMWRLVSP